MRPPEIVQAQLEALGLGIQVLEFADVSTATAAQAAEAVGAELGSIVKSLLFLAAAQPVRVLMAGDRQADQRKIADHLGVSKKKVKIADAETVRRVTGFEVGGVPPLAHATPDLPVLIDASLGRYETVYAAAGASNALFPIPFATLVEVTHGDVRDLARAE